MKFIAVPFSTLCIILCCACSPEPNANTVTLSPLTELLTPTLASAILGADNAIDTALKKPEYSEAALLSLASLQDALSQLNIANQALLNRNTTTEHIESLGKNGEKIQRLRSKLEAEIISLKNTNAAAAIRLGVVNELSGFCALTALDIHQAQRPAAFN